MDYARRFSGISRLYGQQGVSCIRSSNIAVIGVGGVGSWVVEALARGGIGN
ncbi:MAG: ThiF family adenylyltransferase, partial [Candidatus Thiodiazotropha taylori]|nr:ThiF family adenylyltransferase [Candidatus Thiodiazotropha taylori]MCW4291636.1 ThiF family adenylyltransferase [Candidatus Thiodiazotropha taylori]